MTMRTVDYRARMHAGYWAFAVHRASGLALALFLPVHFWALGLALQGEPGLDGFLRWTDSAAYKLGEWTLVNDPRDVAQRERLRAVAGDAGCHSCHTQGSCGERCPKRIEPTAGIAGLKRLAARAAVRGAL